MFGGTPPSGGLFGSNTSSPFASTPAFGGASTFGASTPAFGSSTPAPAFGSSTPAPAFGSSTPAFASSTPAFGANTPFGASPSTFGSSTPAFGASTPAFGTSTSGFGSSTPAFGSPAPTANLFGSTPQPGTFGQSPFGQTPLFGQTTPQTPFGQSSGSTYGQAQTPLFGQQMQPSLFGSATPAQFGQPQTSSMPFMQQTQPSIFGNLQQPMFNTGQLTTQMAPVAPLAIPLPDREIQAIVDAYKDEPGSPRYAFKHLLLSITDPSMRVKPPGVPELMWAEAMNKLEGMENGGRMWPELMLGFKDLSNRLKLQDEALAADFQRLQATESNVKMLQRHFQVDTLPWIQRLRQKEQELQRRLLRVMRIVEALEVKGLRMPLTRGEAQLGELLRSLARQLHSTSGELPRKVDSVLSLSRVQAGVGGSCTSTILETGKIDDQSLVDIQEVLKQQTEAITRLAAVLKRDMRDIEIMTSDDAEMSDRFLGTEIYKNKLKEPGAKFFPSTFS